jgi:hypothetical protein
MIRAAMLVVFAGCLTIQTFRCKMSINAVTSSDSLLADPLRSVQRTEAVSSLAAPVQTFKTFSGSPVNPSSEPVEWRGTGVKQ